MASIDSHEGAIISKVLYDKYLFSHMWMRHVIVRGLWNYFRVD